MKARSLCWLLPVAGLSFSTPASASMTFPAQVEDYYGVSALPVPGEGCRLCHRDDVGGLKTIATPFGRALVARGAIGSNIPSLLAALKTDENEGSDSDGDGVSDAAELRAGEDPNAGREGSVADPVPLPETGCSVAGPTAPCAIAGLGALLLGLLLRVRRQRR